MKLSCDSGVDMITFLNENYSYFSMNHHDKIRGLFVDSDKGGVDWPGQ